MGESLVSPPLFPLQKLRNIIITFMKFLAAELGTIKDIKVLLVVMQG